LKVPKKEKDDAIHPKKKEKTENQDERPRVPNYNRL